MKPDKELKTSENVKQTTRITDMSPLPRPDGRGYLPSRLLWLHWEDPDQFDPNAYARILAYLRLRVQEEFIHQHPQNTLHPNDPPTTIWVRIDDRDEYHQAIKMYLSRNGAGISCFPDTEDPFDRHAGPLDGIYHLGTQHIA